MFVLSSPSFHFMLLVPCCRRNMPLNKTQQKKAAAVSHKAKEEEALRKTLKRKRGEIISYKEVRCAFGIWNVAAFSFFFSFFFFFFFLFVV